MMHSPIFGSKAYELLLALVEVKQNKAKVGTKGKLCAIHAVGKQEREKSLKDAFISRTEA